MSTYDDAILILPQGAGYKTGEIYSLKPTDGTADATVTRATECDRIDSTGESVEVAADVPRYDFRGDYVEPTDNSYYDCDAATGVITVNKDRISGVASSFEINLFITTKTDITTEQTLIDFYTSATDRFSLQIVNGNIVSTINNGTAYSSSGAIAVSTDYMITLSWDVSTLTNTVYINKTAQVGTTASNTIGTTSTYIYLGATNGTSNFLDAKIKKYYIDNHVLTTAERLDRYNGEPIPEEYKGATNVNLHTAFVNNDITGTHTPNGTGVDIVGGAYGQNDYSTIACEIGKVYTVYFTSTLNSGSAPQFRVSPSTNLTSAIALITVADGLNTVTFTATAATHYMGFNLTGALDISIADSVTCVSKGNTLNLSIGKTDAIWYDLEHDMQGAVTGATLTDGTDFGDNHYPTNTCPVLLSEDSFTNLLWDSRNPANQIRTTVIGEPITFNCKGAGVGTFVEIGGSEQGGAFTEVYHNTIIATSTSVSVTFSVGNSLDWAMITDTDEPKNHVESPVGASITKAADVIEITTPAGVVEIIETINGVEQAPITTIPVTYQAPYDRLNSTIMN